ncbi:TRAP transporter substrate-binding protein DctP [Variovorax sp. VNK109]|uniref:TRAP transporter substrate-binding protein DctP n=1 Tax=Variovorax sp. VNK109 TaxID=3400919 RepID=UPI003BFAE77F
MQRRQFIHSLGAAAIASPLVATGASAQTATWRFATAYGDAVHHTRNVRLFSTEWQAASRGAVEVDLQVNAALKKMPEILPALEAGEIQLGEVLMSAYANLVPALNMDAIPFIVRGPEDARLMWQVSRASIEKALAARGLELLYAVPWPGQGLFSRKAVARLEDLKSMNFRVYNDATRRMAELSGATPANIAASELAAAVADGRVDAMITSSVTGVDSQAWSRMKVFYELRAWIPKNMVCANARAVAALPAPAREALRTMAAQAEKRGWSLADAADDDAKLQLTRSRMSVEPAPFELRRTLSSLGEKMSREWAARAGIDNAIVLLDFFNRRG